MGLNECSSPKENEDMKKNKTFTPLIALISIFHFKDTYLHPGVLGLTDIVEIDERLEDIGVG